MMHVYEVRPRKDRRGVDLISDVLPFGRLWYCGSEEQFGLRDDGSPYLKRRQVSAGIGLFRLSDTKEHAEASKRLFRDYNRKRAKIIRKGLSAPKKWHDSLPDESRKKAKRR
jgi:hypothetical protein